MSPGFESKMAHTQRVGYRPIRAEKLQQEISTLYGTVMRRMQSRKLRYGERLNAFNELFVQASQNLIRINEQYRELLKANESANVLYKEYIDHFQKLNRQWIQYLWSPFLTQAQVKDTEKIREKMKD